MTHNLIDEFYWNDIEEQKGEKLSKYWTAEVFLDGCDKYSTAYMFSAEW